jgi:tRNA (guanine37-N1)-methyltransferase
MLLMIEPLLRALDEAKRRLPGAKVLLMSPARTVWSQEMAREYAASGEDYILICGRYEGFDARIEEFIDAKISIGQYVLTGGELPAMVVIDSIVRLLPGVLGGENSAVVESYSAGANLEFPQYTRPEEFEGLRVPEVLLSGNHGEIEKWRKENSWDED